MGELAMGDLIGAGGNISYDAFTEIKQLVSPHLLALPQSGCLTILNVLSLRCFRQLWSRKEPGPAKLVRLNRLIQS